MSDPTAMGILALLGLLAQQEHAQQPPQPGPPGQPGQAGPPGPPAPYPDVPPLPGMPMLPVAIPAPAPGPIAPPGTLPPMPPWPAGPLPGSLPPFPGPGWIPDTPVTPAIVSRAQYWNPILWDYPSKTIRKPFVQEQLGGQWVTFSAAWHPGDKGPQTYMSTEAWRVASAPPVALPLPLPGPAPVPVSFPMPPPGTPPASIPVPIPPPMLAPPGAGLMMPPGPIGLSPGTGAWQTNGPYIGRYQTSLTYLASVLGQPTWNPKGIDQKFGPNTKAAVMAFQRDNHVAPIDGMVGNATASVIDALVAARGAGPPIPVSVGPPAALPGSPYHGPPAGMPAPPGLVGPSPGAGAWQTNGPFIGRYQTALTYLAFVMSRPGWDPKGVDQKFGPNTKAAVMAFQGDNRLSPVDGKVGNGTATAIDSLLAQHAAAAA